jgi:hypothetical protein
MVMLREGKGLCADAGDKSAPSPAWTIGTAAAAFNISRRFISHDLPNIFVLWQTAYPEKQPLQ